MKKNKSALVFGAGGFIGSHLVSRLKSEGFYVKGVDLKSPSFDKSDADQFLIADLSDANVYPEVFDRHYDHVYQLAADMGGAGYIFSGLNDANVMTNSSLINLHTLKACVQYKPERIFYSSSACIYPEHTQLDENDPDCRESSAYPAAPDSEYGWEKLFSERLYLAYSRNHKLDVRIARFHNIFGPKGTYEGGKEKAPAALARKVIEARDGGEIEIWGDGKQTRSFLYIDACVEGVRRLIESDFAGPVNIGSTEMISIGELAKMAIALSGKKISIKSIPGPLGVRGRNSHNDLVLEKLGWAPVYALQEGMKKTYHWIDQQIQNKSSNRQKRAA